MFDRLYVIDLKQDLNKFNVNVENIKIKTAQYSSQILFVCQQNFILHPYKIYLLSIYTQCGPKKPKSPKTY